MILEIAILNVKSGQETEFKVAFAQAQAIISGMKGYYYIIFTIPFQQWNITGLFWQAKNRLKLNRPGSERPRR